MNRGVARQAVFLSAQDGQTFESLLGESSDEFGIEIHAYCLMTNHVHLLVTPGSAAWNNFWDRPP
jgi:putative transposase